MSWVSYKVKSGQEQLPQVLADCGWRPSEISEDMLNFVWLDGRNLPTFLRRNRYTVAEGDTIWAPRKDVVDVPVSPRGDVNLTNGVPPLHVWTASVGTPLRFDDNDARLPDPGKGDQIFGQDNWHVAFDFANFPDLGNLLESRFSLPRFVCGNWAMDCGPIQNNQIAKFAIFAHGGPGGVDVNSNAGHDMDYNCRTDPNLLNVTTIAEKHQRQLDQIYKKLAFGAQVFFMCCMTGAGAEGDEFLTMMSSLWAGKQIRVIGYKSVLYCGLQSKKGEMGASCYPGARETHFGNARPPNMPPRYYEEAEAWNNLSILPWASESTPHASVALQGKLIKIGKKEVL